MNLNSLKTKLSGPVLTALKRLGSDPFFHFAAAGLLVFILYGALNKPAKELHISQEFISGLIEDYKNKYKQSPTPQELQSELKAYVEDELLFREAVKNGLADGDMIIKRRLIQKAHFALGGSVDINPADKQLQTHLKQYAHRFTMAGNISFEHVFFRKSSLANPKKIAESLKAQQLTFDTALGYGDGFLLGPKINGIDYRRLVESFGLKFAQIVVAHDQTNQWQGPIASTYGIHLVRVTKRKSGQLPKLARIRNQVREDYIKTQKEQNKKQMIENIIADYDVHIQYPAETVSINGGLP